MNYMFTNRYTNYSRSWTNEQFWRTTIQSRNAWKTVSATATTATATAATTKFIHDGPWRGKSLWRGMG
jgi:hypothetical protein